MENVSLFTSKRRTNLFDCRRSGVQHKWFQACVSLHAPDPIYKAGVGRCTQKKSLAVIYRTETVAINFFHITYKKSFALLTSKHGRFRKCSERH